MPESEDSPTEAASLPRFQFSLRSQMIAVTIVAVLLGLFVIGGQTVAWVLFYGVVYCLVPTPLIIGALFGRGEIRTFSIGALVPWIAMWGQSSPPFLLLLRFSPNPSPGQILGWIVGSIVFFLVTAGACGVLAVATRRWIERRSGP